LATGPITLRAVRALEPGETLWDAGVKGFGVRCQRDAVAYVIKYRFLGRQRFMTIGRHGVLTPDEARRAAKAALGAVAAGRDPAAEKTEARAKAADTLGRVAVEYLRHAKAKLRPGSYAETERHLLVNWRPLHPMSVFGLRRREVTTRLAEIAASRGPVAAIRARAALSAMFNWAIREGYEIAANPVLGTNHPAEPKSRERVLSDSELAAIWRACGDDDFGRIVRLLILTAQRRDEVGGMRWAEIDGDAWVIPGSRTKNHRTHIVPLTEAALALIYAAPRQREYLFGNGRGFTGWSKAKAALDDRGGAAGFQPGPWRLHDLRRTAATVMADRLGVLPHIVEAVLNHVSGHRAGVAGVYNRAKYEAEMRDALQRWAGHLAAITRQG
jgi:integrase